MSRRSLHRSFPHAACLALGLLAACAHVATEPGEAPAASVEVRLIAFNDFHGYIDAPGDTLKVPAAAGGTVSLPVGGAAYLAGAIQAAKAGHPRSVVVAAGDLVGASPLDSGLFHDEPAIEALGRMGLELSSVGNHEFDQGRAELLRKQNGGCHPGGVRGQDTCVEGDFPGARFHYLAANVVDSASGQTLFPPYEIKTLDAGDGRKLAIAFVGLVLKATPTMVTPSGVAGLQFTDEADAANALLPQIRAQGASTVVILIHQGGSTTGGYNDKSCPGLRGDILPILDRLDPAFQVIVSGHTHQAYNCRYGGRLLTSAGSYGRLLSTIDLRLSAQDGSLLEASADNIPVVNQAGTEPGYPAFPADPAVAELVARYDARSAPITRHVLGRQLADLTRAPLDDPASARPGGETALGEVVADSELDATRAQGAVAAFINSGGVRSDLLAGQSDAGEEPGQITYGEAYKVLPFGNHLLTMTLSGEQLYALLDEQWGRKGQVRMLQVSRGFSYAWDDSRPAESGKVLPGSLKIDGKPVRAEAPYRITVVDFLAAGGDGFSTLTAGTERVRSGLDIDAFAAYLERNSPLAPPGADRVRRLDR
jgi:5'-nucleotidase